MSGDRGYEQAQRRHFLKRLWQRYRLKWDGSQYTRFLEDVVSEKTAVRASRGLPGGRLYLAYVVPKHRSRKNQEGLILPVLYRVKSGELVSVFPQEALKGREADVERLLKHVKGGS